MDTNIDHSNSRTGCQFFASNQPEQKGGQAEANVLLKSKKSKRSSAWSSRRGGSQTPRVARVSLKLVVISLLLVYLQSLDVISPEAFGQFGHISGVMGSMHGVKDSEIVKEARGGADVAEQQPLVEIRDQSALNAAGLIKTPSSSEKEWTLRQHAENVFPQTAKMLGAYDMLVEEIRNQSAGLEQQIQSEGTDRGSTEDGATPLIARQQSVITQLKAVENLLDPATIQFENSVGIMNKQQFFSEHEQRLMTGSYQIEDILHHRLIHLANLTSTIVYDDAERLVAQDNQGSPGMSQKERSQSELNPRNNPQFDQLKEFYMLARGELPELKEKERAMQLKETRETSIEVDGHKLSPQELASMGPFFQQTALRPTLIRTLKESLDFHVAPKAVKNTTFYAEAKGQGRTSGNGRSRVSYKFHKSREPSLFAEQHPYAPIEDEMLLFHDDRSIHHDILKSFEDLHVQAVDEREQWPPFLHHRGGPASSGKHDEVRLSRQYQERYYQQSACKVSGPGQERQDCLKKAQSNIPKFEPPFGGFMREMHEGSSPSVYDYPAEEIANSESQRVLRKIMSMKALHLHNQNFERLKAVYGVKALGTAKDFQQLLFTYEEPDHIKALMQGSRPQKIQELPSTSSHSLFFENDVDITPRRVYIRDPIYLLTPFMETIKVKNERAPGGEPIIIHDIFPSSPDVDARLETGQQFPITVQPGETARIRIIATPGNYGRFDALVYILLNDRVFVSSFRAHVFPNRFGLEPIYLDHVTYLSEVNIGLNVGNPYPKQILVEELYLTNQKFEAINMRASVEANSNKTLCNITYRAHSAQPALEQTMVAIRFSTGDYVRVPVYIRTVNNIIETTPHIIDFGLVQLNQQPLRMDVWIRLNEKNIQRIVDYLLPVDQVNLDFKMYDPVELSRDTRKQKKMSERQRRQRKPCLDDDRFTDFFAGQVVLNPVMAQFVSTSIKMEVELREDKNQQDHVWLEGRWTSKADVLSQIPSNNNKTIFIDIPIIASVVNHTELFSAVEPNDQEHSNSSEPRPLYALDLTVDFNHSNLALYPDLQLKNNLARPIAVQRIFSKFLKQSTVLNRQLSKDFYTFKHHDSKQQLLIKLGKYQHSPGDVVAYGEQEIKIAQLPFRNGQHLLWLRVNQVTIPAQIQVFNRQLLCEWLPDQHYDGKGSVTLCQSLSKLDFGALAAGEQRSRVLKVWNPNSVAISMDQAIKSQLDDLTIELDQVLDRRGTPVEPVWRSDSLIPQQHKGGPTEIMSSKRTKKYIGLIMQPFESVLLRFKLSSSVPKRKGSKLSIICGPQGFKNIDITHVYSILQGELTLQPTDLVFSPGLLGMPQSKILTTRSTFSVPTTILSVTSLDPRIEAKILSPTISPWNVSISAMITFDASRFDISYRQSEYVKQNLRYSIESTEFVQATGGKNGKPGAGQRGGRKIEVTHVGGGSLDDKLIGKMQNLNEPALASMLANLAPQLGMPPQKLHKKGQNAREGRQPGGHGKRLEELGGLSSLQTGLFRTKARDFDVNAPVSYEDLSAWYDRRDEWHSLERLGQNFINTSIQIQTDVSDVIEVPVSAKLHKPEILMQTKLDFGNIQIGQSVFKDIEITNPSAEPIQLQLFVGYDLGEEQTFEDAFSSKEPGRKRDLSAHTDRLLKQMNLFVKGVDLSLVEDVESMFETFRREHNGSTKTGSSEQQKPPSTRSGSIVDILLSLQPSAGSASQKQTVHGAESKQKGASKGGNQSQASASASIQEILHYWQQFEKDSEQDYASKYCLRVFLEHADILEQESFMAYFEGAVADDDEAATDEDDFTLSESEDAVDLCLRSIKRLNALSSKLNKRQSTSSQTPPATESPQQSINHQAQLKLAMQNIQNFYQTLYQHVYDLDWLVDKCLQQCHLAGPLDHLSNLTSVDSIPSVLKSIEFFDQLHTWKQQTRELQKAYKMRKIDLDLLDPTNIDSLAVMEGARAQLLERYLFYQTQRSPITASTIVDHRHVQKERKASEELLKLDVYLALLTQRMRQRQQNKSDQPDGRGGRKQRAERSRTDHQWLEKEAVERQCRDQIERQYQALEKQADASSQRRRGFYLETLASLGASAQELLVGAMDALGYVFAADLYEYARLALTDNQGDLNPLGSLSDRFQLKNADIQRQMILNNLGRQRQIQLISEEDAEAQTAGRQAMDKDEKDVHEKQATLSGDDHHLRKGQRNSRRRSLEQRVQHFYLNPIYKNQIFTVAPRSNITIRSAVIFQPLAIEQVTLPATFPEDQPSTNSTRRDTTVVRNSKKRREAANGGHESEATARRERTRGGTSPRHSHWRASKMQLIVKNNLTVIENVGLNGHGTSAMLELVDIQKDFVNVLDEEDEIGAPAIVSDRISVRESQTYNLSSPLFQNCGQDSPWADLDDENVTRALQALKRRQDAHNKLLSSVSGTDFHIISSLFDASTDAEYELLDDQNQDGSSEYTLKQPSSQKIVSDILSQKSYRQRSDKQIVDLHEQSFSNYVVFNIPLSDVFRKAPDLGQTAQQMGTYRDDADGHSNGQRQQIRSSVFYADEDLLDHRDGGAEGGYCQSNSTSMSQRRMRGLVDKPTLRQRVATALGRWDTQDLRADLNWTELSLQAQRGKVDIVYQHTRYIILQNTGAVPLRIQSIRLDDSKYQCSDSWRKLNIQNCLDITQHVYMPGENVTIELVYTEDYKYSKSRKTLTIETEQFSQKFLIDFIVPQRAQILVQKAENQLKSASDRGLFSIIALLGNIVFMLILLYLTMLIAAAMKKDFEDQGILTEDSLLGFDTENANKGKITAGRTQLDEAAGGAKGQSPQIWRSEQANPTSSKLNTGSKESSPQPTSSTTKKKALGASTISPEAAFDDFLEFCSSKFVADLLPVTLRSLSEVEQTSPPRGSRSTHGSQPAAASSILKSPVFAQFELTNHQLAREPAKFTLEALRHCQMKNLETFEAQELAKRALLGKKTSLRPSRGHEASQLLRTKNAIHAAVAGLEGSLDRLEKEQLKKQIDAVSMKVSQAYSVLKTGDIPDLDLGEAKFDIEAHAQGHGEDAAWQKPSKVAKDIDPSGRESNQQPPKDDRSNPSLKAPAKNTDMLSHPSPTAKEANAKKKHVKAEQSIMKQAVIQGNEKSGPSAAMSSEPSQEQERAALEQKKRRRRRSRSSSTAPNTNQVQVEPLKMQQDQVLEAEAVEQQDGYDKNLDDSQNTDQGLNAAGISGTAGAGSEAKDKKSKVKKLNKKELKKKEARLKREQELAENTKRMEILQQEKDRQIQLVEAQQLMSKTREQQRLLEETEGQRKATGVEYGQDQDGRLDHQIDGQRRKPGHFDEIDIKSYHSSEDESRRRNESPGSTSEASGQVQIIDQKRWREELPEPSFTSKKSKALYNSLDGASNIYSQTLEHDVQMAASKQGERNARQKCQIQNLEDGQQINSSFDSCNQTQTPTMADKLTNLNRSREVGADAYLHQEMADRRGAAQDDFWKNYEKKLGIIKDAPSVEKERQMKRYDDEVEEQNVIMKRKSAKHQEAERYESMSNLDQFDSREESLGVAKLKHDDASQDLTDTESVERMRYKKQHLGNEPEPEAQGPQIGSDGQSNSNSAQSSPDSDQDDDLPLFQQKKYLQLQEYGQQAKKPFLGKGKAPVANKSRETAAPGEEKNQVAAVGQAGRGGGVRAGPNRGARAQAHLDEDHQGVGSRRVYEKNSLDDAKSDGCAEMTSRERAQRLALLRSRNPYADINNPNNPNYKGRPGNKDIESYLAQQKILREREQRKQSAAADSSEEHDSEDANSYDDEQDGESRYKHYRGEPQRLEAGDSFDDSEEAYYNAGHRFGRASSKYGAAGKYTPGRYDQQADYGSSYGYYRGSAGSGGGRGRARGQAEQAQFEEHYLHRAASRGGRGRGRGRGTVAASQHKYDDYPARDKRQQQARFASSRYEAGAADYYRDGTDSAEDYHSKQYDRRSRQDWHDLRERDRDAVKNQKNDRVHQKYGREVSREAAAYQERDRQLFEGPEYPQSQSHAKGGRDRETAGGPSYKEKVQHPGSFFSKDKDDVLAEKGSNRLEHHHIRDGKTEEVKYDHDQIMLMRRVRGRALLTSEAYQRGAGRGERGSGRGERGGNSTRGNRGSLTSTPSHQFPQGRGRGQHGPATEAYKFKVKEKEQREAAQQHQRARDGGLDGQEDTKRQKQQVQIRGSSSSDSNASSSGSGSAGASHSWSQQVSNQLENAPRQGEQLDSQDFQDANDQIRQPTSITKPSPPPEDSEQRGIQKTEAAGPEAVTGASKSVYETFMDVSSIFSNPILSFKGTGRTRSRFFDDVEEEDDMDEPDDSVLEAPGQAAREAAQETFGAQGSIFKQSIFSSSHLFGDNQRTAPSPSPATQSVLSVLGQGLWQSSGGAADNQEDAFNVGTMMAQERPQFSSPPMFGSGLGAGQGGQQYPLGGTSSGTGAAGLSATSFADLRRRALDAGRNEYKYSGQDHDKTNTEQSNQMPQPQQQDANQSQQVGQGKKFMSLGALPVPKFLQESKARENQYQKLLDDDEPDSMLEDIIE